MNNLSEGEEVERDNVALREEMLRYNVITDSDERYPLMVKLVHSKLIVPVNEETDNGDELPTYATLYGNDKGRQLFVYTSVLLIPESCKALGVVIVPFLELAMHLQEEDGFTGLRIDPGTDHGVGILFKEDGPLLFRLKRLEDYLAQGGDLF